MGGYSKVNDQAQKLRELVNARTVNRNNDPVDLQNRSGIKKCKSLAVTSGKGGVGKTNLALYLSICLACENKKVLLLDADLGLANVHILLGVAPKKNISHFVEKECSIDELIYRSPYNIDIIPGGSGLEKLANLDLGRLEYLQHEFSRIEAIYDYIIVDTGAGIGNVVTHFASNTDAVLLVVTPEPTSLADSYAMVKVLYDKGCEKICVIVNMCLSEREGNETFDRLNTLVVKFLKRPLELYGFVPMNRELSEYIKRQKLIIIDRKNEHFTRTIKVLAKKICGTSVKNSQGFFAKIFKFKNKM
jgi:flagellar biosynthesis protein FlhG